MNAVRFRTVIENGKVLPLPADVHLAPGPAEVIVLQDAPASPPPAAESGQESLPLRLARKARELDLHGLPADLAENHDHYLHALHVRSSESWDRGTRIGNITAAAR